VPDTLVFDGDCAFCTSATHWVEAAWPDSDRPKSVAWQLAGAETLAALGITEDEARSAAWWIDAGGKRYRGHQAVGKALAASTSKPRRLTGKLILIPPVSWLARALYPLAARYRYRLPGGTPACRL
jgi:predicted DCC family thiol-disulfide oxidoreductase YuxK